MDFEGQRAAERLQTHMLFYFAAAAFLLGYLTGNFQLMVLLYAAGGVLALVLVVPDWPMFNKHPLQWLPPLQPHPPSAAAEEQHKQPGGRGRLEAAAASEAPLLDKGPGSRRRA
jgi:signal peptidase complex subunit 1